VESGHSEEDALHRPSRYPGAGDAQPRAHREKTHAEREELTADLPRQRAERHANADFATALCHGITRHAVRADGGEQQRHACKDAREQRGRTPRGETVGDTDVHGPQIVDGQLKKWFALTTLRRFVERFRRNARSAHHEQVALGAVAIRMVDSPWLIFR
jgi:hypothetical protein